MSRQCNGKLLVETWNKYERCSHKLYKCESCGATGCTNENCTQHLGNGSCLRCGSVFIREIS